MTSSGHPVGTERDDWSIVMVIGPGRSGTSTIAGALARCGLEVPGRVIKGNATNPSGFYEPRWVVDFHRDLLQRNRVGTIDSSPRAMEVMARVVAAPEVRDQLRTWLATRLERQRRLVVKDPRSIWFRDLWVDVARDIGVEPGFVTMLRHPAEVSASRQKYYRAPEEQSHRADEIAHVSGWVNVVLTAELVTQGSPRGFVRYSDLVEDWRAVLKELGWQLGLSYDPELDVSPHPVDELIDPSLHRVRVEWSDVDVPDALRDLAERVWQTFSTVAIDGESAVLAAEVDALRGEYAQMNDDALALTRQAVFRGRLAARRRGWQKGVAEERARVAAAEDHRALGGRVLRRLTRMGR